jgi:transcriptional regulator with XRE-family HTH domain
MAHRLPNYLRTHRKRAGLSQDEVAFLMGCESGAKVSRYEMNRRQLPVETVFAYEAVFGVPARELLAGVYDEAEQTTRKRAGLLAKIIAGNTGDPDGRRKVELLNRIAAGTYREASDVV